jgi:SAM-dependent methyltransferase
MPHWTKELFEEYPELFLTFLEDRVAQAACEVDLLLKYLKEQRFTVKKVLDLNCGIGRHSLELARRGITVVGTDLSAMYIKIAKERAKKEGVEDKALFKVADMREIASKAACEQSFDGIVNLYTSFGFYDDETNDEILRQCLGLVRAGGFFALETVNRDFLIKNFQSDGFSRPKDMIVLEERDLDAETSRMKSTWTFLLHKSSRNFVQQRQITIDHRVWSLHELIEMFERTGWEEASVQYGFNERQLNVPLREARSFLFIARKPKR